MSRFRSLARNLRIAFGWGKAAIPEPLTMRQKCRHSDEAKRATQQLHDAAKYASTVSRLTTATAIASTGKPLPNPITPDNVDDSMRQLLRRLS